MFFIARTVAAMFTGSCGSYSTTRIVDITDGGGCCSSPPTGASDVTVGAEIETLPSPGTRERAERAALAEATMSLRRSTTGLLDYRATCDQAVDDDDYRNHQQNVDQAPANVHDEES
jgi:hypothetical protein